MRASGHHRGSAACGNQPGHDSPQLWPTATARRTQRSTTSSNLLSRTIPLETGTILCHNREQSKMEEGITQRFEKKIAEGLTRMKAHCENQKRDPMTVERDIGKLPRQNTCAEKLLDVK
jgi:hypothetical protein